MTITLRFLKALTATTTAMQAEVLVITALLDGNIQIHCQKELLNLIERFYSAPKPDKFSKLDASYSADLDQIFKNFNANLLALYVKIYAASQGL